jgi:hypothetical protein
MHCSAAVMQKTDLRLITLRNRRLGASAEVGRHDSDECKQGLVNALRIDRGEIAANHAIPFEALDPCVNHRRCQTKPLSHRNMGDASIVLDEREQAQSYSMYRVQRSPRRSR